MFAWGDKLLCPCS